MPDRALGDLLAELDVRYASEVVVVTAPAVPPETALRISSPLLAEPAAVARHRITGRSTTISQREQNELLAAGAELGSEAFVAKAL